MYFAAFSSAPVSIITLIPSLCKSVTACLDSFLISSATITNPKTFSFVARITGVLPCAVYCSSFELSKESFRSCINLAFPTKYSELFNVPFNPLPWMLSKLTIS